MVNLSDTYILDKCINKKTGESTDREHRRKGQKIKFINLNLNQAMIYAYENGGVLRTSRVRSVYMDAEGYLLVTTYNTVYGFKEIKND